MLLIVGDGIREGAGGITEFLEGFGSRNFPFGLVGGSIISRFIPALRAG